MATYLQTTDPSPPQQEYWNCVSLLLAGGGHTLVDSEDFARLAEHEWRVVKSGVRGKWQYAGRWEANEGRRGTHCVFVHHVVAVRPAKGFLVDHRSRNTFDNRKQNLRVCTNEQNLWNTKHRRAGKNQYRGVYWQEQCRRYVCQFAEKGKKRTLGFFTCPVEAAKVWDAEARRVRGEFAVLNFPSVTAQPLEIADVTGFVTIAGNTRMKSEDVG